MFRTRLLSGIVLVAILLATGILGGNILWGFCFAISMIGLYEFYRVFKIEKSLGIIGYLFAIIYYLSLIFYQGSVNGVLFLAIELMAAAGVYVLKYPKYSTEQVFVSILGLLYLPMMLSYVYQIRIAEDGLYSLWLIFISSWGCDTCAYCVGMLFGKRKLAPVLSPKKSIEGAVGGAIGAAILGAVYGAAVNSHMVMENAPLYFAIICAVAAVISQFGDLIASGIKRQHGIKDYGKLIPGHGGILDRFDSVIFTAPVIYALLFAFA
jgi:phosphatidate cytidylyltransferase